MTPIDVSARWGSEHPQKVSAEPTLPGPRPSRGSVGVGAASEARRHIDRIGRYSVMVELFPLVGRELPFWSCEPVSLPGSPEDAMVKVFPELSSTCITRT